MTWLLDALFGFLARVIHDVRRDRALMKLGYTEAERDAARKDADAWRNRPRDRDDAVDRLRRAADDRRGDDA